MDWFSIIISKLPIIISIISLIIAIWAAWTSKKASDRANKIALGELEKSIRDLISQARRNMEERLLHVMDLKGNKEEKFEVAFKTYKSAIEDWLNAYEEACSKYLDGKVDKNRFREIFRNEIRNIVEIEKKNIEIYELINPEGTSTYKAIWRVYKEWENEE